MHEPLTADESPAVPERPAVAATPTKTRAAGDTDEALLCSTPSQKPTSATISLREYEYVAFLGRGSFAEVTLARHIGTNRYCAIKKISKKRVLEVGYVNHIVTERRLLGQITHPFLAKLYRSFQSKRFLYLVLGYAGGGDMYHLLRRRTRLDVHEVLFYGAELCLALHYLHSNNFIYRDLKPENVLIGNDGHILLTDFGVAKSIHKSERTSSFTGTVQYMAPEVLTSEQYNHAVDWWSLGCLLFELANGRQPFVGNNEKEVFDAIIANNISEDASTDFCVSEDAPPQEAEAVRQLREVVRGLMCTDASRRLGANSGIEVLCHPFFRNAYLLKRLGIDESKRSETGSTDNINSLRWPWYLFEEKRVTPPFHPDLESSADTKYFAGENLKSPSTTNEHGLFEDIDEMCVYTGVRDYNHNMSMLSATTDGSQSPKRMPSEQLQTENGSLHQRNPSSAYADLDNDNAAGESCSTMQHFVGYTFTNPESLLAANEVSRRNRSHR